VQNLKAWEDAKKDIAAIPDHPNQPPVSVGEPGGTAGARRDSNATESGL
jgi:hypothetical protein